MKPVLGYYPDRDERHRWAVVYFDEEAQLWYLAYGGRFIGPPASVSELVGHWAPEK